MQRKYLIAFLIVGFVTSSFLNAFAMDGQQESDNQNLKADIGSKIRPEIKTYIDELYASEIISIEHTTDGIEESRKRSPAEPKNFSAGRYKVVFSKNGEKKAVIFQTEEKVGHISPVIPGKTDIGGFVEILIDSASTMQGRELSKIDDLKLNEPELDYLIRILYRKFEKPL